MVFFAFSTSASEGVQELYNALVQAYEGVTANGAGLVLCTKSEEGNKLFADAPFPVILYNDSLKAAVGKNSVMIEDEETANTASWYVNGSFLSSWYATLNRDSLVADAETFVSIAEEMQKNTETGGTGIVEGSLG